MMASLEENPDVMNKRKMDNDTDKIEEPVPKKTNMDEYRSSLNIVDLDTYVLLNIFKFCSAPDLKALAFTCTRFASLVPDRSLWLTVDATTKPHGCSRMQWLMDNCFHSATRVLHVTGYAHETVRLGCHGLSPVKKDEEVKPKTVEARSFRSNAEVVSPPQGENNWPRVFTELFGFPNSTMKTLYWPGLQDKAARYHASAEGGECFGPKFSLNKSLLQQLALKCELTELRLEYCNLDYATNPIKYYPLNLKTLSLKGSKCFNMNARSYVSGINEYLPLLEELDVSSCEWLEPAALLPFSKLPNLQKLVMADCDKLYECVAYTSLATRHGFRALKVLDTRLSPLGDSEISAFGWLPALEELYLECRPKVERQERPHHMHYPDDPLITVDELEDWEKSEIANYFITENTEKLDNETARGDPSKSACLGKIFTPTLKRHNSLPNRDKSGSGSDGVLPLKKRKVEDVNNGASTSRSVDESEDVFAVDDSDVEQDMALPNRVHYIEQRHVLQGTVEIKKRYKIADIIFQQLHTPNGGPSGRNARQAGQNAGEAGRSARQAGGNAREAGANAGEVGANAGEAGANAAEVGANAGEAGANAGEAQGNAGEAQGNLAEAGGNAGAAGGNDGQAAQNADDDSLEEELEETEDEEDRAAPYVRAMRIPLNGAIVLEVNATGNLRRLRSINNLVCPGFCFRDRQPDDSALITDSCLFKFGRSAVIEANYIDIGHRPRVFEDRPDKAKLKTLVCKGYVGITDYSLMHLLEAAPDLKHLDVRGANIKKISVQRFKLLKPDCQVLYEK